MGWGMVDKIKKYGRDSPRVCSLTLAVRESPNPKGEGIHTQPL